MEAVGHCRSDLRVRYEAGARRRAVVFGQGGLDIFRGRGASRGKSVVKLGKCDGQLLGHGSAIRGLRDGEGRGSDARAVALGRGGEMERLVAACPLPERLRELRRVLDVALMVSEMNDA